MDSYRGPHLLDEMITEAKLPNEIRKYKENQTQQKTSANIAYVKKFTKAHLKNLEKDRKNSYKLYIRRRKCVTDMDKMAYDYIVNLFSKCKTPEEYKSKIAHLCSLNRHQIELWGNSVGSDFKNTIKYFKEYADEGLIDIEFYIIKPSEMFIVKPGIYFLHKTKVPGIKELRPTERNHADTRIYSEPSVFFYAVRAKSLLDAACKLLDLDEVKARQILGSAKGNLVYYYKPKRSDVFYKDRFHVSDDEVKLTQDICPVFIKTNKPLPVKNITGYFNHAKEFKSLKSKVTEFENDKSEFMGFVRKDVKGLVDARKDAVKKGETERASEITDYLQKDQYGPRSDYRFAKRHDPEIMAHKQRLKQLNDKFHYESFIGIDENEILSFDELFQEGDIMELSRWDDLFMEASEDNDAPDDEETPTEEKDTTKKEDNASTPEEATSDNVGDDDEIDLSDFGNNGGDDLPNNEYDTSEVETLNKLIASEASALSEYMDAAKTSHEDILQRLYSDIGDEERFHLEQLMFAKSELTGEKYIPRDPAVKKEYEELLELGMDEESAMATAVDKTGLRKQIEEADGDIEQDTQKLETEIEMLEAAVFNTELLMTIMEQAEERRDQNLLNQIYAFSESYYQEAVMNSADASDDIRKPFNPFQALWKLLMGIMRGIATLIANFKKWIVSMRQRRSALQQWIQNHGIQGLFDSGVWLYLWNDQTQSFDFNDMAWYIDALYVISADCAKDGFITNGRVIDQDAFNKYAGAFQSSTVPLGVNGQIPNREEALNRIQSLNMTKTKIIVNQQNENIIREMWFGYTDDAMIKFNPENKPVTLRSKNIYNAIQYLLDVSNYYGLRTGDLIKGFQTIGEGSPNRNSIFYTNRNLYNEDYRQLKIVVKGYSTLSKCFTHDLKTIMWVNNGVLERTNAKDAQNNDPAHRYPDPNQTRMFVNNKSQQELNAEKYSRDQWYKNHQTAVQNGNTTPPPRVTVNK